MEKSIHLDHLMLGVCYYPEHWPETLWQEDLRRMKALGIERVRVFEFAWNIVEPTEGVFDFDLFDKFLDLAYAEGMTVIMCTPTATPPAWLTTRYPETLNADKDGNLMHHGHRRHYNYNSPVYLRYVKKIVSVLAERYGQHPAIVGWQIDNEINCEMNEFYSEADRAAFRVFLEEKFVTLDALNDAIGARFWNQTYSEWNQVDLERHSLHGHCNPHMALLEKEFFSLSAIRFVKLQSDLLRPLVGQRFITTNGIFGHLDNERYTQECLDFMTYDSYPNFAYGQEGINGKRDGELGDRMWSMNLSRARALSPNFGVMEQQSGANGWDFSMLAPMPLPGQMRLWTMQAVANGADYISYFRWRTAPYGTEIYWHGLNDYANTPNRRLDEVAHIHRDFKKLTSVAGSKYVAKVALLNDYPNEWDGERDLWHGPLDHASRNAIFAASQHTHTPMDLLYLQPHMTAKDLRAYDMIFYPHPSILSDETATLLKEYCELGGKLVLGARTGYKDEYGRCPMRPMPGPAASLCGITVREYTLPHPAQQTEIRWNDDRLQALGFWETLIPNDGTETLAFFAGSYLDGECAMTRRAYANGGAAYYLGSGFAEATAVKLLAICGVLSPYDALVSCPADIELALRVSGEHQWFFLLNYTGEPQTVEIAAQMQDALTGALHQGEQTILPYDLLILQRS
ncbi:MAG: beta-galactosidase [Eubacteriales bacterium]|nr:beta-galactosidase [Eubacteriales bacterium]